MNNTIKKIFEFLKNLTIFIICMFIWLSIGCYLDTKVSHLAFKLFLIATVASPLILDWIFSILNRRD